MSDVIKMVAGRVLAQEGFETQYLSVSDLSQQVLIAENHYVTVAILAGSTRAELAPDVDACSILIPNWVAEHGDRAKLWDVYLIALMAGDPDDAADFAWAELLENDTRRIRKLVRWGVVPEADALSRALAMFLPLTSGPAHTLPDPLDALVDSLRSRGVPPDVVDRAMGSFRRTGEITV